MCYRIDVGWLLFPTISVRHSHYPLCARSVVSQFLSAHGGLRLRLGGWTWGHGMVWDLSCFFLCFFVCLSRTSTPPIHPNSLFIETDQWGSKIHRAMGFRLVCWWRVQDCTTPKGRSRESLKNLWVLAGPPCWENKIICQRWYSRPTINHQHINRKPSTNPPRAWTIRWISELVWWSWPGLSWFQG